MCNNNFLYLVLDQYIPDFKSINPEHKKWYVVSNLSKSFIFSLTTYHTYSLIIDNLFYDKWDATEFKYLGPRSIQSLSETPECVLKLELPQILNFVVTPSLSAYVSGI